MFSTEQLSKKIADYAASRLPLSQFEDWFREQSEDVHVWGGVELEDYVFAVENIFSQHYFENLTERAMRAKLTAEAERYARPFVRLVVEKMHMVRLVEIPLAEIQWPREHHVAEAAAIIVLGSGQISSGSGAHALAGYAWNQPAIFAAQALPTEQVLA